MGVMGVGVPIIGAYVGPEMTLPTTITGAAWTESVSVGLECIAACLESGIVCRIGDM